MTKINLSLVQMASIVKNKKATVSKALKMIDEAMRQNKETNLIMLPELFNTEYFPKHWDLKYLDYAESDTGYTVQSIAKAAVEYGIFIVTPIFEKEASGIYFNTSNVIDPSGKVIAKYRKTHLPALGGLEKIYFRPGSSFPLFSIEGCKIGMIICYDVFFPETARILAIKGAEVILIPFGARGRLRQPPTNIWDSLMKTRAFENAVYVAACNKIGPEENWVFGGGSMIVGPKGNVIVQAPDEETIISAKLDTDDVDEARRTSQLIFRDLRPELYSPICRPLEELRRYKPPLT